MLNYVDFELDGIKLSSFGGYLYNADGTPSEDIAPSVSVSTEVTENIDGETPYSSRYNPLEINLDIYIENENFDKTAFMNWMNKKGIRRFNYVGSDRWINVVRTEKVEINTYNSVQRTINGLKFMAYNPYWKLIVPNKLIYENPEVSVLYKFTNKGNTESLPIISLECKGEILDVQFEINGIRYKMDSIIERVFINAEDETVYNPTAQSKVNRIDKYSCISVGKFKYTFPKLNVGENTFKLIKGNVTKATIDCNSIFA